MDFTVWVVLAAVISFIVGILCQRFVFSDGLEKLKISNELKALRKEYHDYQIKVSDHLQQTTRMISNIQTHYDEVQSHLFSAAQEFNKHDGRQSLLQPHSHYVSYGNHGDELEEEVAPALYPNEFFRDLHKEQETPKDYV